MTQHTVIRLLYSAQCVQSVSENHYAHMSIYGLARDYFMPVIDSEGVFEW